MSNNEKLQILKNKFLCCVPVRDIELLDCVASLSWDDQELLLNQTVKSNLLKKFPIKSSYQKAFLKAVLEELESNCIEVHDRLYESYCQVLNCEDQEKYYYKHYMVEEKAVTLKENKNFISEGTTGLCSWQASLALSQWCLNNKNLLKDKVILELGSGVGLVGLTIAQHCHPKEVVLSDCHPKVLSVLSENVSLNFKDSDHCDNVAKDVLVSVFNGSTKVSVLDLAWETVQNNKSCERILPDFVLAADVVYDNSVFGPLCGAVTYFLGRNPATQVVFACTERNPDTLREFLGLLESHKCKITNIPTPSPEQFHWLTETPILLYLVALI